jgi:hypothetical protein
MQVERTPEGLSVALSFDEAAALMSEGIAGRVGAAAGSLVCRSLSLHPSAAEIGTGSDPFFTVILAPPPQPEQATAATDDPAPDAHGVGTDL